MNMKLNNSFCALVVALVMPLIAFGQDVSQTQLRLARLGYPDAMYEVGMSYLKRGDTRGLEEAYDWFLKSAKKDYIPSEAMVACLLKKGVAKQDNEYMMMWVTKAISGGDGLAAWLMAQIAFEGNYDQENIRESLAKAFEFNYPLAKLLYAKLYATGSSEYQIRKDITRSNRLLQELSGLGMPSVSAILGAQLLDNPQQAFRHLKSAADAGIPAAMSQVANMYYHGQGVTKNLSEAFKYYEMAAEKNDPLGIEGLADCYRIGAGTGVFLERAFNLYNKLDASNPRAEYILGNYYNEGVSVAKDRRKAIDLFQKAASGGNVFAQALLGTAYYDGNSLFESKDFNMAYSYLSSAVKNKDFSQLPNEMASKTLDYYSRCLRFGRGGASINREEADKQLAKAESLKKNLFPGNLPFASAGLIPFSDSKERCGITWNSEEFYNIMGMVTLDYPKDYLNEKTEPKKVTEAKTVTPPVERKVEKKQESEAKQVKQTKQTKQVKPAKLTPVKNQSGEIAFFIEAAPIGFGPSSVISSKDENTYWLKGQVAEISASAGWLKESGFIGGGVACDLYSGGRMSVFNGFVDIRYTNGTKNKGGFIAGARAGVAYGTNDLGIGISATGVLGYMIPIVDKISIDFGLKAGITLFQNDSKTKAAMTAPFIGICF